MRILFTWEVNKRLRNYLENHPLKTKEMELIFLNKEALEKVDISKPKGIQATVGWVRDLPYFQKTYRKLTNLELIVNPGVGVERAVPVVKALNKKRKIILCNGHGHTYFTAQHAMGMLLALSNQLPLHHTFMKNGIWRTGDKEGASLPLKYRKTGLLGYGPVNQHLHRFLKPFGTKIYILKNTLNKAQKRDPKFFDQSQLETFCYAVDNLMVALPLTDKTKGMIGKKELNLLGEKGLLVNVARGPIIKEKALFKALKNKKIAAAGIDVWYNYHAKADKKGKRFPFHYPFHQLDNVLLSPHRGGSPMSDLNRWDETMEILNRFVKGKKLINVVDLKRAY